MSSRNLSTLLTESNVESSFKNMSKLDAEFATSEIRRVMAANDKRVSRERSLINKIESRQAICDEQHRRMTLKYEAYKKASYRSDASNAKLNDLQTLLRRARKEAETEDNTTGEWEDRLTQLNELYGSSMCERGALIHALSETLDSSEPVKYELTPTEYEGKTTGYRQELSWTTSKFPLRIKRIDENGVSRGSTVGTTRTQFGPFEIRVSRAFNASSKSSSVEAWARLKYEDFCHQTPFPGGRREGNPHPHVDSSSDGTICLGTSKAEILRLMKSGDYPGVLYMVMDVLQSYNPRDPYRKLDYWEPTMHSYGLYMCSSCNQPELLCDCARSSVSGQVVDPKFLSDCGCTYQECLIHHERSAESGSGINGTACTPSRHSNRYQAQETQNLSEAIEALGATFTTDRRD